MIGQPAPVMPTLAGYGQDQSRIAQMFANARQRRMNAMSAGNDMGQMAGLHQQFASRGPGFWNYR